MQLSLFRQATPLHPVSQPLLIASLLVRRTSIISGSESEDSEMNI